MKIKLTEDMKLLVGKNGFKLTKIEYLVLKLLITNKNKITSLDQISNEVKTHRKYAQSIIMKFREEFGLKIPVLTGYELQEEVESESYE